MSKDYYIYILTNISNAVLYIGVTNNLNRRLTEHKDGLGIQTSFTKKYNVHKLVYYETYNNIKDAVAREKQLKAGSRKKKEDLIRRNNPKWDDLGRELFM